MSDTQAITVETAIAALELPILRALQAVPERGWCVNLYGLTGRTGIPRELCRALVKGLIERGLAEYQRGLWSEDGTPAGSGYSITDAGRQLAPAEWGHDA